MNDAKVLVVAEHDGAELYAGTLNTVTAGVEISGGAVDVHPRGHCPHKR